MRRHVLAAATLLALAAPTAPASAGHAVARCGFTTVRIGGVTGDGVAEGAAYGAAAAPGDTVSVRCVIRVNGEAVAATPPGAATPGVAVTAGYVAFVAAGDDLVELCAVTTTSHGTTTECLPPQPLPGGDVARLVADTVDEAFADHVDPAVCGALAAATPGIGPVGIGADGDVHALGERVWDCPPFG